MAIFRKASHSRLVAWLALVAMCLVVVMPVLSRSMPMPMPMHSMDAMGADAELSAHGFSEHHPPTSPAPSSTLDKCGYCSLFCHSPMVAGDALPPLPTLALPAQTLLAAMVPAGPPPQLLSAAPRGPPSLA